MPVIICLHVLLTLKRPLILCCTLHYYLDWQNLTTKSPFMTLCMYHENDLHVRIHDTLTGTFAPKLGVRQGDDNLSAIF